MTRSQLALSLGLMLLSAFLGCQPQYKTDSGAKKPISAPPEERLSGGPDQIAVQHVLIGFSGSVRGKDIERTKEQAEQLAQEVLQMARQGADFTDLVRRYSDDYDGPRPDAELPDSDAESAAKGAGESAVDAEDVESGRDTETDVNGSKTQSPDHEALAEEETESDSDGAGAEPDSEETPDFNPALYKLPGVYRMANYGVAGKKASTPALTIYERQEMVGAFGNVGFKLEVGEIGLAEHNSFDSPFGWHIIKRLE